MKKLLSVLLAICLLVCLLPVVASAATAKISFGFEGGATSADVEAGQVQKAVRLGLSRQTEGVGHFSFCRSGACVAEKGILQLLGIRLPALLLTEPDLGVGQAAHPLGSMARHPDHAVMLHQIGGIEGHHYLRPVNHRCCYKG